MVTLYENISKLRNADLRNTKLGGAKLSSTTKLDGAKFGCINDPSSYLLIYPFSPSIKCTNFTKAVNLTPEQVKSAENWEKAKYDKEFRAKLGLTTEKEE